MSLLKRKTAVVIGIVALAAALGSYWAQWRKAEGLKAEIEVTAAQLEKAKADVRAAEETLAARDKDREEMQKTTRELAVARDKITELQEPRAATAPATPAPEKKAEAAAETIPPGTYVERGKLRFVGYATPAAAIYSLAWAMVNGRKDVLAQVVAPGTDPSLAENLGTAMDVAGPALMGMQVVAEKVPADDRVELLVKVDTVSTPATQGSLPPLWNVLPMTRVDHEWKLSGPPLDYSPDWRESGQVTTFGR